MTNYSSNPRHPQPVSSDPGNPNGSNPAQRPQGYPAPQPGLSRYPDPQSYPRPQSAPPAAPFVPSAAQPGIPETSGGGSEPKPRRRIDWNNLLGRTVTAMLTVFLAVYFGWLFAPRIRNQMTWWPTNTPTPVTPSPTPIATATITPLATNTITPMPTATPEPLSEFWVAEGSEIDPAVPDAPLGVIELHVDSSAELNPALDSGHWTGSKQIVADLGKALYQEEWYATYAPGWVRWFMDRPLREGLYELYIMDTVFSSGGSLTFSVQVGDQTLTPLTGTTTVHYMTSQYDPVQAVDTWRSLGTYYVQPSNAVLTVTTSWQERDEYTIVSMDRLLIVPRLVSDIPMLNALPAADARYVRDDMSGDTIGKDYAMRQRGEDAWDGSYQLVLNPKDRVEFTLPGVEPWPIGNYRVYAWMPTTKGGITANYSLTVDRKVLASDSGEETVPVTAPSNLPGQWIEIGSWTTDRYYERPRKIGIRLEIESGAVGEFPIDAIAFIYTPFAD